MKKLPEIQSSKPNIALAPYFESIYREISNLDGVERDTRLQRYVSYLEVEAQRSTSVATRVQLRINIQALLEKLGDYEPVAEITVKAKRNRALPRFSDEAYYDLQPS